MPDKVPTRLRDLAEKGGQDVLRFDPRNIEVEPGHNVRMFDTDEMRTRIAELKTSIAEFGVISPLRVRYDAGRCVLVDGETRLRACLALIADGVEVLSVPVIQVKGNDEAQRIFDMLISNTGKAPTQLEAGAGFQRLVGLGFSPEQIASKVGHSLQYVTTSLELFDSPLEVKKMVADKTVTAARAVSEVKKHGTRATETLKAAVEQKKSTGGGVVAREKSVPTSHPAHPSNGLAAERSQRQQNGHQWAENAFGKDEANSLPHRGLRHAEEAIEAAQAAGTPRGMLHQLIDSIYDKPKGDLRQEIGGSGLTLLLLAATANIDADEAEADELARVMSKPLQHFTERNAAKNAAGFFAV